MGQGVSVKLFLVDGTPDGLKIVEKSNWTGIGVTCSRAQYPQVQGRHEFDGPGVYVLVGPSEVTAKQAISIGEADIVRSRLNQHIKGDEFWTSFVLFSSKDANLNNAHVRYLESKLVERAAIAKRAEVRNGNSPSPSQLSEADQADIDSFLKDMLLIYPLLGISAFEIAEKPKPLMGRQTLYLKGKETNTRGEDTAEGFVALAGSVGSLDPVNSFLNPKWTYLQEIRQDLIESGVLVQEGLNLTMTQNYTFSSPSTAAGVLLGRHANGRKEWKNGQGVSLKDIQEAELANQ